MLHISNRRSLQLEISNRHLLDIQVGCVLTILMKNLISEKDRLKQTLDVEYS